MRSCLHGANSMHIHYHVREEVKSIAYHDVHSHLDPDISMEVHITQEEGTVCHC